jgi:hypothetical protein
VVLLDVRPRSDFDAGHIAGSVSIPLDELADPANELPPGTDVVAYCRGPFCWMADRRAASTTAKRPKGSSSRAGSCSRPGRRPPSVVRPSTPLPIPTGPTPRPFTCTEATSSARRAGSETPSPSRGRPYDIEAVRRVIDEAEALAAGDGS